MKWQPIQTAPKDGTPILLYQCVDQFDLADPKGKMTDYCFSGFYNQRYKVWECWESDQFSHEPTHWMPLPKPPSSSCNDLLYVPAPKESQTVVKVETSYWHDKSGAYAKKSLKILKRKSWGYNLLLEECGMNGAEVVGRILNFNEVHDGIYELIVCNISKDWETGYVDDWDLKLIPFST